MLVADCGSTVPPCSLRYAIPDAACFGQRMISGIEIGIQGVFWIAHEGQTPGKNLMGLKVVRKVSNNLMMGGLIKCVLTRLPCAMLLC